MATTRTKNYGLIKPDEDEFIGPDNFNDNFDNLDDVLIKKSNAATVVQTSLSSGGWSGGKYSFETQYPTNKYDITVEPDGDKITEEGYKAWGALKATGSISNVLIAKGKIPAVDIAVILRVVEKNA